MANLDDQYTVDERTKAFENHNSGLLISLAGPGTGKTYSFLRRIEALVSGEVLPSQICYITFIKDISRAFLSDYQEEYPENIDIASRPRISTLHSFACRLIRNKGFSIGYDGELYFTNIADSDSSTSRVLLNDLLPFVRGLGITSPVQLSKILQQVKKAWQDTNDHLSLEQPVPTVWEVTLNLTRTYRLFDWDQTIPQAHELFQNVENRDRWITQLTHYLVDEYQDFNLAEQAFLASIASTVTSMVIVGDDNQSIYHSRGGSPEGMRRLFQSSGLDRVSLLKCRRCKTNILRHVNRFLVWMSPAAQPMLPHNVGGVADCFRFKSSKAELNYLADYLANKIAELPENPKPKDGIVCLFPTRKMLNFYFENLQSRVPSYTGKPESDSTRLKFALLLELVCNPHQRFIERLILESFSAIKPRQKSEMVNLIIERDISPTKAIEELISNMALLGPAMIAGQEFFDLCENLSSQDPTLVAYALGSFFRRDPSQLLPVIEDMLSQLGETDQEDLIQVACDRALPELALPSEDRHSVIFLTMHGCKGLTKKTVVLPGLEHAWLPGNATGADLEERKRLFYVAMTRATDNLLITYPINRARGDPLNFNTYGRKRVSEFVRRAGISERYHG